MYSTVRDIYINGSNQYPSDDVGAEITLDFTEIVSTPVVIGSTGISFSIGGGPTFTDSADKTWEFLVEAPFSFRFDEIFSDLLTSNTSALFKYKPTVDVSTYENLWNKHFNPVYRVAGLLLAYVTKLSATL